MTISFLLGTKKLPIPQTPKTIQIARNEFNLDNRLSGSEVRASLPQDPEKLSLLNQKGSFPLPLAEENMATCSSYQEPSRKG